MSEQIKTYGAGDRVRVLVVTSEWPSPEFPYSGVFVARQVNNLRNLGIDVEIMNFRGKRNVIHYFNAYRNLQKHLSKDKYDLIHAHFGHVGFLCVLQSQVPVIITFHGSDLYGIDGISLIAKIRSYVLTTVSTMAARLADEIILVSNRLIERIPKIQYNVIPLGVDLSLFRPFDKTAARKTVNWSQDERTILFVGDPKNSVKRYPLAFESSLIISKEMENTKLRICYNVRPEDIPIYMNAADVLIMTSVHEAGPLVILEALACNLPVVAVDVGFARKYIENIQGCIVCHDDQPETIADALRQILKNPKPLENGRASVRHLDECLMARKVAALYKKVLVQ